ncbi:DNRLRE domain-containing protein [Lysinibacillus macroides]|uniref:Carbohydrate-binding module family 96 domain-containing protein n=1 Tax=Lysinibacillus macroides TaxID=33935 RepID=A0A0M9DLS8_9BACI|nr:DNRLRE domain-containing protein [Lysinibacillus macroides]KOY83010.1 hypothetical protein ADM90_06790 [Lysinibacillus macroides]QPR70138.1 DNRLRE domain-containing protein [Lysinibacillus macroides]
MEDSNINFSSQTSEDEIVIASIADSSFICVEYEVKPNNLFQAKYKLIAVGQSDTSSELTSRVKNNATTFVEITARTIGHDHKNTDINIMYRGMADVLTEIQPIGYNNLAIDIEVPPHNRMWATYEVQQPPIVTEVFNPFQDAFTRENLPYQSINYGSSLSMVVGRSADDIWRSFVQFDLSWFNPSYRLTDAKLRLYYTGSVPQSLKLELFNANSTWSEYSITHLNRPTPIELIADDFTVNMEKKYVEFNTLKIVENWIQQKQVNNGFILRVANESFNGLATFRTRESMNPPELIVNYYDSRIFSFGRSQVLTEINTIKKGVSDSHTEIEVDSVFRFSAIDTYIYAHRKEVPLDEDIIVEITASLPKIHSEIIVAIPVDDDIFTGINVRIPEYKEMNVELSISRPIVPTEIFSSYIINLPTEIVARTVDDSEISTALTVSRSSVATEILPRLSGIDDIATEIATTRKQIPIEISVSVEAYNDTTVELEVINEKKQHLTFAEISVSREEVLIEISPRVENQISLYTEISTTRDSVYTEIFNRYASQVLVEIEPIIKSDSKTEITASTPKIWLEITSRVMEENNVDTEIFIPFENLLETEITAHITNNVDTIIDIISVNKINVEITATKPNVWTEIVIPTWVDLDIPTTIEPRILMVHNIATIIVVNGKVSGYAFIM